MPNIVIKIPSGTFPADRRAVLVSKINEAAATAEKIPDNPKNRFLCWVLVEEVDPGAWTCGATDVTSQVLPCMALIYVPTGVLDNVMRAQYLNLVHNAFKQALPESDKRQLLTSVILHEVTDGNWGAGGAVWRLADFAKAAGFLHLQTV
jgi:phenylpyruvate tautomerase PptA (4-oxalocrotonate tautomerase family)